MYFPPQASLERIGVDSKGTVYWYDGGKNMFQSPPSNDPAYKPRYVHMYMYVYMHCDLQLQCYMYVYTVRECAAYSPSLSLSLPPPLPLHSESELQLSCKSMVQWTAKLK